MAPKFYRLRSFFFVCSNASNQPLVQKYFDLLGSRVYTLSLGWQEQNPLTARLRVLQLEANAYLLSPHIELTNHWLCAPSCFRQRIFDLWRHLRVDLPMNYPQLF
jgi:hypothetical protein